MTSLTGQKVLIIVENLPVPFDRRVWQEAKSLKNAGAEVTIICPTSKRHNEKYEILDGIRIYRHRLPIEANSAWGFILEYASAILQEAILSWIVRIKHGFDVIHVCNPPDLLFIPALPHILTGKKLLFDHHDLSPELFHVKFGKRGPFWKLLILAEKITFNLASVVISTNESYRDIAISRGKKKPEDVFVVRSGPNLDDLPEMHLQKEKSLTNQPVNVGYVGVIGTQDGVSTILMAAHWIKANRPNLNLVFTIIGDGPAKVKLEKLHNQLNLSDIVKFTGYLSGGALHEEMRQIDIGVCPDPKDEYSDKCTTNKLMEYMAFSIPTVQFDLKEGRYTCGDCSLYAEPDNLEHFIGQILKLASDQNLRAELGIMGRQRIERELAWSFEEPKLINAYQRLLPAGS